MSFEEEPELQVRMEPANTSMAETQRAVRSRCYQKQKGSEAYNTLFNQLRTDFTDKKI